MIHKKVKFITGDRPFGKTCGRRCNCLGQGQFCQNFCQIATRLKYVVFQEHEKKTIFQNTQKSLPIALEGRIKCQKSSENKEFGDIPFLSLFQMVQRALGPRIIYFCYQIYLLLAQNFIADLILAKKILKKVLQTPKLLFLGCFECIRTSNNLFLPLNLSVPSLKFHAESKSGKKNFEKSHLDP